MLSAYSSEHLQAGASEVWKYSLRHLILDIQTALTQQKSHFEHFWWNYNNDETYKPYLDNKEQKRLFKVASLSDVLINFDFARPFFLLARSGAQIKLRARNIGRVEVNLSNPGN